jgi:peroxiredoxin
MFALLTSAIMAENGYQVGDIATDFKLKNVDGQMMSLKDQKNVKGYVVTFTCNTCPFAKLYEDRLIQLHNKYAPQGYPVVAINPNDQKASPGDSFTEMQKRAKDKKFPFAYLYDETQEVAKRFGATRTPHLYILQKTTQGQLKIAYIGALDNNSADPAKVTERYAETALNSLLANQTVAQNFTKAIGCTIKWRAEAQ